MLLLLTNGRRDIVTTTYDSFLIGANYSLIKDLSAL